MNKSDILLSYYVGSIKKDLHLNTLQTWENTDVKIVCHTDGQANEKVISINLYPKKEITVLSFCLISSFNLKNKKMMVNGYQTWTQSKEMSENDKIHRLHPLAKKLIEPFGDYSFYNYSGKEGILHSYTYTYFSQKGQPCIFIGSINEKTGYTIFEGDFDKNQLTIRKDCTELIINEEYELLKLYLHTGEINTIMKEYFKYFPYKRNTVQKFSGWTSWYNYYTNITEDIILKNLYAIKKENIPIDIFQIDDGYQNAVGDWLITNSKFPSGMKYIADEIKSAGYKSGIWLAPFICEKNSNLYNEHPDWILRDSKNNKVKAGINFGWSGTFYALDFYNPELRSYLKEVFNVIFNRWGFEMVKLDFLYAAAILSRNDKTRGQIMDEAIEFLMDLIGDRLILGCGVPLAPAFKKVDFCRIGSDVAPYWEDNKLKFLKYRERVSTINSLYNTISRHNLNKNAFYNDPDVFILRKQDNKLNNHQKYTLFLLNNLLGGLVFFSDCIEDYDEKEMNLLKSMYPTVEPEILAITLKEDLYSISFTVANRNYIVFSNLSKKISKAYLPQGLYYNQKDFIINGDGFINLNPYETKCYHIINTHEGILLIGTTGHIFPGCEIDNLIIENNVLQLQLNTHAIKSTTIYLGLNKPIEELIVNGKSFLPQMINGYSIVEIEGGKING